MSTRRQIPKKASLKSTFTPPANPLKTRGFGNGIQARRAELPRTNLLQTRPFGSPPMTQQEPQDTRSVEEQLEGKSRFGYNGLEIPVNAPIASPPPPPIQRKEASAKLGNWQQQQLLEQEPKQIQESTEFGQTVQLQDDGSGAHGTEEAGIGDRLKKQFWYRVADTAETLGMTNAARHMRHYLNNTGASLTVNVDQMLRDVPGLQARFQAEITTAQAEANSQIAAGDPTQHMRFAFEGQRRNYYATKSESEDWFFAMGGFTYWYTAEVEVIPSSTPGGNLAVNMIIEFHVFDRYNWDKGKSVTIGPFVITDESLGQLHQAGLAQEYEVNGTSSPTTTSWSYTSSSPTPSLPEAGSRDGERTDPWRDRSSDRRQDRELRDTPNRTHR